MPRYLILGKIKMSIVAWIDKNPPFPIITNRIIADRQVFFITRFNADPPSSRAIEGTIFYPKIGTIDEFNTVMRWIQNVAVGENDKTIDIL